MKNNRHSLFDWFVTPLNPSPSKDVTKNSHRVKGKEEKLGMSSFCIGKQLLLN